MSLAHSAPALLTSLHGDWATPNDVYAEIVSLYGAVTLDAAALSRSSRCQDNYFGPDHRDPLRRDALAEGVHWADPHWHAQGGSTHEYLNPPYGRGIGRWIERAIACAASGVPVTLLLPARTDTIAFQAAAATAASIHLLPGRLAFTRPGSKAEGRAPFPSVVLHLTPESVARRRLTGWLELTPAMHARCP